MLRYTATLVLSTALSALAFGEPWVPMGSGKIFVGAKPHEAPKDASTGLRR